MARKLPALQERRFEYGARSMFRTRLAAATVFLSSALLFFVELTAGKLALPRFGGTAGTWVAALMAFQLMVLIGYGWAHLTQTYFPERARRIHLGLGGALLAMQAFTFWLATRLAFNPGPWGVTLYLLLCGGPLLTFLAATGPLVQADFARSEPAGPWWLYQVSSIGSLAMLLAYPPLIEPWIGLRAQLQLVAVGAGLLWVLLAARPAPTGTSVTTAADGRSSPIRPAWLVWPALGGALLSSTSNVLCQDVAPTPLLWVVPLALYLLSFSIAFGDIGTSRRVWAALWLLSLFFIALNKATEPQNSLTFTVVAYSAALFCGCVLVHHRVFLARPHASRLGAFYLAMAAGGAAGSTAVSIAAPLLFSQFHELNVLLVAASVAVAISTTQRPGAARVAFASACIALVGLIAYAGKAAHFGTLETHRNFYGVTRVRSDAVATDGGAETAPVLSLLSGNILHGREPLEEGLKSTPSTYYGVSSGYFEAIAAARSMGHRNLKVKTLGLGLGTAALTLAPGDTIHFYEINEAMVAYATGATGPFSTLKHASAAVAVHLGDARQLLERETAPQPANVLLVDVFSGDAIPSHLLTLEAFEEFRRHLAHDGLLAIHITNLHLDLEPIVYANLEALGFAGVTVIDEVPSHFLAMRSTYVVASSEPEHLPKPSAIEGQKTIRRFDGTRHLWRDERNSLLPVLSSTWRTR